MKTKTALFISLCFNLLFIISILTFTYIYRDKIYQRFVHYRGNPDIVMFGNSITAQGKWVELLARTDVANSGLAGFCTYNFLQFTQSQIIDLHPKICFVMGGINDITVGVVPEKIQAHYQSILETIVKNKIIPVVTLTLYEQDDSYSKAQVDVLNNFLMAYCKQSKIEYLDLNQFLSDSTGLKAEFAIDKTHLNEKAYKIWAREIKKVLIRKGI